MSWLKTETIIDKIVKNADVKTLKAFQGICAIDKLPTFIHSYPILLIVNTHTHNLPGEHWIVLFIDKDKSGEVFDSLTLPISNFIIRWMNRFTRKWKTNGTAYQHPTSATCGAFVIFYVLKRLSFQNFLTFKNLLTLKPHENERRVLLYFHSLK